MLAAECGAVCMRVFVVFTDLSLECCVMVGEGWGVMAKGNW